MGIADDNNFLVGSFKKDPVNRDASEKDRAAKRWAIGGIGLAVIWLFGVGSLFAILCGFVARFDAQTTTSRRLANAAILLGLAGLIVGIAPFFFG